MVPNRSHDDGWSEHNFPQLWAPFELCELEICPGAQTVVGGFLRGSLSDPFDLEVRYTRRCSLMVTSDQG